MINKFGRNETNEGCRSSEGSDHTTVPNEYDLAFEELCSDTLAALVADGNSPSESEAESFDVANLADARSEMSRPDENAFSRPRLPKYGDWKPEEIF